MDTLIAAFQHIAPRLNTLKLDPNAHPHFECLSGALIWTDEGMSLATFGDELSALRGILHYRSSLIFGKPRTQLEPLWNAALKLAPNWPAFLPNRRAPHPDLIALIPRGAIISKSESTP